MKNYYNNQPNGYLESIQKGLLAVRSYDLRVSRGIGTREEKLARLKKELETVTRIVISIWKDAHFSLKCAEIS